MSIEIKYPKIKYLGDEENTGILTDGDYIVVQEKIDGGNFRFKIIDGELIFGTRNTILGPDSDRFIFAKCIEYIKGKILESHNFFVSKGKDVYNRYIFFGECCVKHTIGYDWSRIPPFLGFDIYDTEKHCFLYADEAIRIFTTLNIPVVPEIYTVIWKTDLYALDIPQSKYYNGKAEGIVIKNYSKQLFAKIVSPEFKEENKKAFGASKKHADNDDEKIVLAYCTNARIQKWICKLRDGGHALDMTMMTKLPLLVYDDIFEEQWREISKSNLTVSFRTIRSMISKRCAVVLKTEIVNSAFSH